MSPGKIPHDMFMSRGQRKIQFFLLDAALVAVPWMFLPKTLIFRAHNASRRRYERIEKDEEHVTISTSATVASVDAL